MPPLGKARNPPRGLVSPNGIASASDSSSHLLGTLLVSMDSNRSLTIYISLVYRLAQANSPPAPVRPSTTQRVWRQHVFDYGHTYRLMAPKRR